jgi:hypothetical protein
MENIFYLCKGKFAFDIVESCPFYKHYARQYA